MFKKRVFVTQNYVILGKSINLFDSFFLVLFYFFNSIQFLFFFSEGECMYLCHSISQSCYENKYDYVPCDSTF